MRSGVRGSSWGGGMGVVWECRKCRGMRRRGYGQGTGGWGPVNVRGQQGDAARQVPDQHDEATTDALGALGVVKSPARAQGAARDSGWVRCGWKGRGGGESHTTEPAGILSRNPDRSMPGEN